MSSSETAIIPLEGEPPLVLPWDAGLGSGEIHDLKQIRTEMKKVYKSFCKGEVDYAEAARLTWILDTIRRALVQEQQLEILKRGGISGEPFVGMIIEGPSK